jgi:SAM-dependent methyltransferase
MEEKERTPWYEDAEFWQAVQPVIFDAERLHQGPTEVEHIIRLLDLQGGERICDLCCGVGRHSVELARRGYKVTAVDRTKRYLAEARAKAETEHLDVEFIQEDIRAFQRSASFDVVLNLFTSFGYFEAPSDDRRVVENVYRSLKRGGRLLLDLMGKEVLARIFRSRDWRRVDGTILLTEAKVVDYWSAVENEWTLVQDGAQHVRQFSHRLYSAAELAGLLQECGFGPVAAYGGLHGIPYDEKAERLVIVGRK